MTKAERIAERAASQDFLERKSTERRIAAANKHIAYWAKQAEAAKDESELLFCRNEEAEATKKIAKLQKQTTFEHKQEKTCQIQKPKLKLPRSRSRSTA